MDIERIDDLATAKQVARLAIQENARLTKQLAELTARIAELEGKAVPEQLAIQLADLQEQLGNANKRLFGDSSEKRSKEKPAAEKKPQTGHGPTEQHALVEVESFLELDEDQRRCPCCDEELKAIPGVVEESTYITVVPAKYIRVKQQRQKYRCKNECPIVTAPNVAKVRAGGRYSVEFAGHVATGKYLDHLPLERQARMMKRAGLVVTSQTLWDQVEALAEYLQPTYEALRDYVLGAEVVGVDETRWPLLTKKGKGQKSTKKWWAWGVTSEDACWYRIHEERSTQAAAEVLEGFEGTVIADGYKAYQTLANREGPKLAIANCWAHVRRKFVESEEHYPEPCGEALDLIGKLFEIDHEIASDDFEERKATRQLRSRPIVDKLFEWARHQRGLPKGGLRRAIEYMLKLEPGLRAFLDDPRIKLDNNGTERALRGLVLGRKNHYGSKSKRGTEVAALLYSLLETAKLCDVNPEEYLIAAVKRAMDEPGAVLLPQDYA